MDERREVAVQLTLQGPVQGRGLRPQILRRARELRLRGWVENTPSGVHLVVLGTREAVQHLVVWLKSDFIPPVAVVEVPLDRDALPAVAGFTIRSSEAAGTLATPVPPDRAVCAECLAEIRGPSRRTDYLLTTCTRCGPRFSITAAMPFDRDRTSLRGFPLCPECAAEYGDPDDRRCHAQTIGCARCGPNWWVVNPGGPSIPAGELALARVLQVLRNGSIVALRGVGGYQLLCDATNAAAVERLRQRKQRPAKPFAIMVAHWTQASRLAAWDALSEEAFGSPANPIVLVPAKEGNGLAPGIHPRLREVGIMAPTTPWHAALLDRSNSPLVVTSGNRDGEPLVVDIEEAETRLADIADLFVHHNRPIRNPVDDSVVRVIAGKVVTLRLARGLAPLVLPPGPWETVPRIALGGQQKVALALANGQQAILGPHLGDLDNVRVRTRLEEQLASLQHLYGVSQPEWVHDSHPDYSSSRLAREAPERSIGVDHHHAHILAGMLEAGWIDREVLGVAFDGTGWGPGGQLWGGEFLLVSAGAYRRLGNLRPMRLPGGERAIREPWRVALALLAESLPASGFPQIADHLLPKPWRSLWKMIEQIPAGEERSWCPCTTSVGRLFDGVAALLLGIHEVSYEGEAAAILESQAEECGQQMTAYPLPLGAFDNRLELDWRPLIRQIVGDLQAGYNSRRVAACFHGAVAAGVVQVAARWPGNPVVLSGGCFQNRLLVELIARHLAAVGRSLFTPGCIPPNDGGLAAGQLVAASMQTSPDRDMIAS